VATVEDRELRIICGPATGNRAMTISGLLITLTDDPETSDAVITALQDDPRIDVGERLGPYLPVVADTTGKQESQRLWDELRELAGVINVNLAFAHLDDEEKRHADE
jgi:nitrate reductase NapAB chaperone NapD